MIALLLWWTTTTTMPDFAITYELPRMHQYRRPLPECPPKQTIVTWVSPRGDYARFCRDGTLYCHYDERACFRKMAHALWHLGHGGYR